MRNWFLAWTLLWAPAAWALPITDPLAAACADRGGSWWAFDVGGTCLMPRGTITPRETVAPRETVTPRLDPPLVLPPSGGGATIEGGGEAPPLHATPEPTSLVLLGTSLAGVGVWWRMRRGR